MRPKCCPEAKNGRLGGRAATWEATWYIIKLATAQAMPPRPVKTALHFTSNSKKTYFYLTFSPQIFLHSWQPRGQEPPFPKAHGPWL